jgi:hypothetical protein
MLPADGSPYLYRENNPRFKATGWQIICTFRTMIRLTSIFLSSLMLLQSLHFGVSDLMQLDELMEHARYHKQEFGDTFLTFLSKHYGDQKQEHQQDQREEQPDHEQLPFQQAPHKISGHSHFYVPGRLIWDSVPESQDSQSHNFHYLSGSPDVYTDGVFQPPRLV